MEKRVFLAIFLCFAVLAGYELLFGPKPVDHPPAAVATPGAPVAAPAPGVPPAAAPEPAKPVLPVAAPLVADSSARDIVVETDTIRAVFSSAGATLTSWSLKRYADDHGHPFNLVPTDMPADQPRPFTLATDDAAISARLATALYQPSAPGLSLGSATGTLSFEYRDASGLNARKTFHFQPEGKPYVVDVEATVDIAGASQPVTLRWGPALGLGYKPDGSRDVETEALQFRDDKVERIAAGKLTDTPRYEGALRFAGVDEQYFLSVALPGTQTVRMEYQPVVLPVPNDPKSRSRKFIAYGVRTPGAASLPFFLGPKDFDVLHAVDPQLVRAINFGMFAWLVVPLLQALKWINSYLGNYGWSIVVLTILINLLIFPLRHRSMVSMRKMQKAQPEIKAIQERFAKYKLTDPERGKMNQELMAFYKQKGINPASGCVPMLLTFPVLLAFYAMLSAAIELRGAPFMWWIHDLSLRDPYWITPLLMGGTMFWQQRMMPAPGADPIQQKIFLFMPVFFTFTFLWAPSGMVLYWLMSNLMGILQQTMTLRLIGDKKPGAPAASVPALKK
jgi:YidC/Oxa1 family membrane protein insertase